MYHDVFVTISVDCSLAFVLPSRFLLSNNALLHILDLSCSFSQRTKFHNFSDICKNKSELLHNFNVHL